MGNESSGPEEQSPDNEGIYPPHFPRRNDPRWGKSSKTDFRMKVILLGGNGVGKTCLMTRFVEDTFSDQFVAYKPDFKISPPYEFHGQTVELMINDPNHHHVVRRDGVILPWERQPSPLGQWLHESFYQNAALALIVLDQSQRRPFDVEVAEYWLNELGESPVHVAFVVNKIDLQCTLPGLQEDGWAYARLVWCASKHDSTFPPNVHAQSNHRAATSVWHGLPPQVILKTLSQFYPYIRVFEELAGKHNKSIFYCSAKTGVGVKECIMRSAHAVMTKTLDWEANQVVNNWETKQFEKKEAELICSAPPVFM